jgi:predicted DCC family thiol-disulfide oxidoreductase YuxK
MNTTKVIFFDGECPMCNGWVKRFIRWDKNKIFRFAPLESETAKKMLGGIFPDYLKEDTIIYYDDGKTYVRSTAAFKILSQLGWPYSWSKVGFLIPRPIRDGVYRLVASQRYRYGKRYDSCPVPPPEWRDRFI